MLDDIFRPGSSDKLMRAADFTQGAYSILVGVAANESLKISKEIKISDLVNGLSSPVYPAMPGEDEQIPYVRKSVRSHHKYTEEELKDLAV